MTPTADEAPRAAAAAVPTTTTSPPGAGRTEYRALRPERIVATAQQLVRRIGERFPQSGLRAVAVELEQVAQEAVARSQEIRRPNRWLQAFGWGLIASLLALLGVIGAQVNWQGDAELFKLEHFVQSLEAGLGSLVFLGAAIVFLVSLERRWKRERLLKAMRELRALAHIVDMHQLTKDPESTARAQPTPSSPQRTLTTFQLSRYLDYCSELLSLINKIGAIYVQEFPDPVALDAADQVASLTNGLSRNIWQKIMILDRAVEASQG